MLFPHVIEQHAELLPFLWTQRAALADAETTAIGDLNRFDLRLHGNLEGLLLAGAAALPIAERAWTEPRPGTTFARASLTLAADDVAQFAELANLPAAHSPLLSALGFAPAAAAIKALDFLAMRGDLPSRQIASRGHRVLRVTQGLASLISDFDPSVYGPAIEAAGLARRVDDAVMSALHHATRAGGFGPRWALWLITGDLDQLEAMLETSDIEPVSAALAARLAPPSWLAEWIAAHREHSRLHGLAIVLAGAHGLAKHLGWLGESLGDLKYSAQAARALRLITGAPDLAAQTEQDETSEPVSAAPALRAWVEANAGRFDREERYLAGVRITPETVLDQLRRGTQGVRLQAAFEAVRGSSQTPVMNTRAPAFRQLFALRNYRPLH